MRKDKVRVIIEDMRRIPTIGKGPIRNPIYISVETYNLLKMLGYNVIKVQEEKMKELKIERNETVKTEETQEPTIEETVEEVVETQEEAIVEETELNVDGMTKKELKAELDAKGIEYAYNATVDVLRTLLKESL